MDWTYFWGEFEDPHLPGLIVIVAGLVLFILGVARHQKRVEKKLDLIIGHMTLPTKIANYKREQPSD